MVAALRSGSTSSSWPRTSARWRCRAGRSRSVDRGRCANGNRGPAIAPRWPGGPCRSGLQPRALAPLRSSEKLAAISRSYNGAMNDSFSADLHAELDAGLRALSLDPALAEPLLAYLALLARWNQT